MMNAIYQKYLLPLLAVFTMALTLTGCGDDPKLVKFESDINAFCTELAEIDADINAIDARSATAKTELLDHLDKLDEACKVFAEMTFPEDFAYLEELADEAGSYMSTAVASYHEAYSGDTYDADTAGFARQNYERACKRINIILQLLRGEEITAE